MAAIARMMPAKQQNVSPMKMEAGQALNRMRATVLPRKVTSKQVLQMYLSQLPVMVALRKKQRSMPNAATMLCPTSRPLIPAQILIVFVWYIPSSVIYSRQTQLSSIFSPSTHEKGGMTSTCVIPVYTQANGKTMKKGQSSLYRQGRSNMSSAKPNRIVPKIVVKMAICMFKFSGVDDSLRMSVTIIPIMVKATAAAKPTHSGIYLSPSLLPFLLISRPKIRFLCMNCETLGMSAPVNIHAHTPESRIRPAINGGICVSAASVEDTASVVVSEN